MVTELGKVSTGICNKGYQQLQTTDYMIFSRNDLFVLGSIVRTPFITHFVGTYYVQPLLVYTNKIRSSSLRQINPIKEFRNF